MTQSSVCTITAVTTPEDWESYHRIRRIVLWENRGRFNYDDKHGDEYLTNNHPFLFKVNKEPVGTTRLDDLGDGIGVVRLVAILDTYQGKGFGRYMGQLVEQKAQGLGMHTLYVNAALGALGYYRKMGWENYSWDKNELTGIAEDCQQMHKELRRSM